MKYKELKPKEMLLLLQALGYKLKRCKCQFCNYSLKEGKFGIFPSTDKRRTATLICDSPLCFCTYLEDIE